MEKFFPLYEFNAYLIPGILTVCGFLLLLPFGLNLSKVSAISFGSLGIYVIVSYAIGHIVQIIGRYIEKLIEKEKGNFKTKDKLSLFLTKEQIILLQKKLQSNSIIKTSLDDITLKEWRKIYRYVWESVKLYGDVEKIEIYKTQSKVYRGLGTSVLLLLPLTIVTCVRIHYHFLIIILLILIFIVLIIMLYARMRGFDKRDVESTYNQYLLLKN